MAQDSVYACSLHNNVRSVWFVLLYAVITTVSEHVSALLWHALSAFLKALVPVILEENHTPAGERCGERVRVGGLEPQAASSCHNVPGGSGKIRLSFGGCVSCL